MKIRLIITYLLNLFDLAMTSLWVHLYGISIEANPIGQWMFNHNVAWMVKIFAVGGLLAVLGYLLKRYPKHAWTAYIPLTAYTVLAVYHIAIFFCTKEIL